jgi:polyribonucleotide nucleotidyltransferase
MNKRIDKNASATLSDKQSKTASFKKMSAAQRREKSLTALALSLDSFNIQQLESIANVIGNIGKTIPNMSVGDKIYVAITKRGDNRLNIKFDDSAIQEQSHFYKIVLGVCRKAHIYCLQNDKTFDFRYVKRGLYKLLFPSKSDDQEKAKLVKMRAHKIYREYYKKVQKLRAMNYASPEFAELQNEFSDVDLQRLTELFITMLEAKQFRIAVDNIEMIAAFLCIAQNRTFEWGEE